MPHFPRPLLQAPALSEAAGANRPSGRVPQVRPDPDHWQTATPIWPEALAGEAIIERFLRGDSSFELSPIALMRALLVQTWRPFGANGRGPASGWALGTLFPEFDELARPIKRRINHAVVAALPISFRTIGEQVAPASSSCRQRRTDAQLRLTANVIPTVMRADRCGPIFAFRWM